MTKLIYKGVDITESITIKKSVLHDYAGNGADDVLVEFPDGERLWRKWKPERGDDLIIKANSYSTGLMYVDNVIQNSSIFSLKAISAPLSVKQPKTRIWRNIKLSAIINDIAKNHSLSVETYGIEDFVYKAISQMEQSDISFLNSLCIREGYCCKITNGMIIVFSEKYMESLVPSITITPDDVSPDYEFSTSDDVIHSFKVLYYLNGQGLITFTAKDNSIIGGSDSKIEMMSSVSEAERWSKGYLRYRNKYRTTAWLPLKYMSELAAVSIIKISGFNNYDGNYYIDKVTHDSVNNLSFVSAHKTLESY
jgi:phage protein D